MNRLKKHLKEKLINKGDKVKWRYKHSLNSRAHVWRIKTGTFIRKITTKIISGPNISTVSIYGIVHF